MVGGLCTVCGTSRRVPPITEKNEQRLTILGAKDFEQNTQIIRWAAALLEKEF